MESIEVDPPEQTDYRKLVEPFFLRAKQPGFVARVEVITERLVADALAAIDASPETPPAQAELPLTQEHSLIRSPDEYADVFARCSAQS